MLVRITEDPVLLFQWDYERNSEDPAKISVGSGKKFWWLCPDKSHVMLLSPNNLRHRRSCKYCARKEAYPRDTDIFSCNEDLFYQLVNPEDGVRLLENSNKPVWWECDNNHYWKATPNTRVSLKRNCRFCVGQDVWVGYNDLRTTDKWICTELLYPLDAFKYTRGSKKSTHWECSEGHVWKAVVKNRVINLTGCPDCTKVTKPEKLILEFYEDPVSHKTIRHAGRIFYPDVYVPSKNLIIEYDGAYWHKDVLEWDTWKTQALLDLGYKVIRIREQQKKHKLDLIPIVNENLIQINYELSRNYNGLKDLLPK